MKILFSGGGTLGPVTPLLAIQETVVRAPRSATFLWIGTNSGPERALVESKQIRFFSIASGKLRRYASLSNFTDIFRLVVGFFQSLLILFRERPDICISAGGFVSVPVHAAAWLLGIPTWVHVQDIDIGLATRCMAPFAAVITTALEIQTKIFHKKKTHWLGNPIRSVIFSGSRTEAVQRLGLRGGLPVLFATGGGTGSAVVNTVVAEAVPHLIGMAEVIHLTGRDRSEEIPKRAAAMFPGYHVHSFFMEEAMKDAFAAADLVVSRGGFGTIAELAALGKPAIFIPKSGHQEANVRFLSDRGAAIMLDERTVTGHHLAGQLKELLASPETRQRLGDTLKKLLPRANDDDILAVLHSITP